MFLANIMKGFFQVTTIVVTMRSCWVSQIPADQTTSDGLKKTPRVFGAGETTFVVILGDVTGFCVMINGSKLWYQ